MEQEQPILFMKTGPMCAEPLGFYNVLAKEHNALRFSTDNIHLEITGGTLSKSREVRYEVQDRMAELVDRALFDGRNVVYDGFLNTRQRRDEVREIAVDNDALTVLMFMHAAPQVCRDRIVDRYERDALSLPNTATTLESTLQAAKFMRSGLEKPVQDEEPHVNLAGVSPRDELLWQVEEFVAQLRTMKQEGSDA